MRSDIAGKISGRAASSAKYRMIMVCLVILLIGIFFLSLTVGRYSIPFFDSIAILLARVFPIEPAWTQTMEAVIFNLRLPRTIAAVLIGGGLALSGAAYQSMFKNPLVSPDLLGVSSGACIGASLAILYSMGPVIIQIWAFIGGIIAVSITVAVPRLMHNSSTLMLVLSGVIVGGLMSSIMGVIKYTADADTALAEMVYWAMGSLADVKMIDLYYIAPCILAAGFVLLLFRYRLNVLSLGEEEAKTLGVDVRNVRRIIIVCATLLTASAVCLAGTIGWVGLVIPHLGRMLVGPDNRKLLPAAVILGAVFMVMIDITARCLTSAELPLSIITGLIGAPFYFYLLIRQRASIT
ncbi:MAG: iron ABC transporter permease [Methanocorpusculum sp.]|jgi:iron complex transport system permease protein|nr:iron ABC transporter permease [Methanocorpusculum sp.]MDD2803607.1 iron ABC transporter permease [Methanocorpusculum sp.]MDD3047410.1 iron ABC transporter permease [Methanocorpusculum sp.]MDY3202957.1 iron ABC transporter permease [Methanocorpusculum sp.]